jgi:hypothetical protein
MRSFDSVPLSISGVALTVALAVGVAFAASDVAAQGRGGKPSVGSGGGHGGSGGRGGPGGWNGGRGGGDGGWNSGRSNWNRGDGWRGGNHGAWRGNPGGWRGYGGQGWHGGRYYYPGWAFGLGVGIGLTYPWWGWGYPSYPYTYPSSVVYERVYDAPVGVVVDRDLPVTVQPAPAYRWYCPSPPGYHPDVRECSAGWLKVLPESGPSSPPSAPLPSTPPRSSAPPADDPPVSRIAPGTIAHASSATRIAAPRMTPPAQVARGYAPHDTVAQSATQ